MQTYIVYTYIHVFLLLFSDAENMRQAEGGYH